MSWERGVLFAIAWLSAGLAASMGCAGPVSRAPITEYPGVLRAPDQLGRDFSVRQHVDASAGGRTASFDGVLQKVENQLLVVGLGPADVRAFVLKQTGDVVAFEQFMGPALPFPPRNILVDVHRAFFKRLPAPSAGTGTVKGTIDGEEVEEDWAEGNLVERRFARPGSAHKGVVRVAYAPGCTAERCAPPRLRIVNEWLSYTLTITSSDWSWL